MVEKNLKFDFGTFSITERKTWKYSSHISAIEEDLRAEKDKEEADGIAKAIITESLRYQ